MLDRTQSDQALSADDSAALTAAEMADETPQVSGWQRPVSWLRRAGQFLFALSFSSLTRRIVSLNIAGLLALVASILYLSQFRAGLIDARAQSLLVQAEIIAGAIAASATVQTNTITIDPERLLDLKPGESYGAPDEYSPLDFPINPERVAPVLRTLISPTKTRARIYDPNGGLLLDSRNLENVLRFDLPPPSSEKPGFVERALISVRTWLNRGDLPLYREYGPENGNGYEEVSDALKGQKRSMVRVNSRGEVIVSVAVSVQRSRTIHGALMLSTQGDDIDQMVTAERLAILKVGGVASAVMIVLSLLLASTIAGPVRRLADSAERVRRRIKTRVEIPDFTRRRDEIGHLSGALRDMTDALYARIEAIEMFAADVAHELKNPLTSLRSAVETLPLARNDNSRARLLAVIEHDVKRLDRLISDISDASRLDAELQRQDMTLVDLRRLLNTLTSVANETKKNGTDVAVEVRFEGRGVNDTFSVPGHDSRLGQVISNLLSNAQSFSAAGGKVRITCRRVRSEIEITVDDDGPGIREDALQRIFERFYTDRPHQGFGQNSGLGLSISKQIIDAHGGRIWAENRPGPVDADGNPTVAGARFIVRLPAS
ncbi:two component Sensor protein chvG (Histidine kinase sensory protein exoS) [Bradyrhizobium sp. ORS 285]|uniref:sensor histidine kinase n=1 Tax=Bradyrhizobium sp. ORS 285 TaxID=115808 RepID=UPI0002406D31|nr:sensor histidine kinase [Bradyrhizobium sp. ORS 285]CCD86107.1 two component Sensor protein chvG (Histidine kinase sensory protein exoS) [Bradyrhizobium sp. ORS 285]SMX55561.1 two component Sensor protein chvG (Histidine kinase sensory protein exoS) [Bradyrhizobium sp. ORS 285]